MAFEYIKSEKKCWSINILPIKIHYRTDESGTRRRKEERSSTRD